MAAGLVVGGLLSFVYYPALAAQLSPKEVFESYQRFHQGPQSRSGFWGSEESRRAIIRAAT